MAYLVDITISCAPTDKFDNGTGRFKNCKQLFEYKHLLVLRDIWWSKL